LVRHLGDEAIAGIFDSYLRKQDAERGGARARHLLGRMHGLFPGPRWAPVASRVDPQLIVVED
jgi:hypothetical protein